MMEYYAVSYVKYNINIKQKILTQFRCVIQSAEEKRRRKHYLQKQRTFNVILCKLYRFYFFKSGFSLSLFNQILQELEEKIPSLLFVCAILVETGLSKALNPGTLMYITPLYDLHCMFQCGFRRAVLWNRLCFVERNS